MDAWTSGRLGVPGASRQEDGWSAKHRVYNGAQVSRLENGEMKTIRILFLFLVVSTCAFAQDRDWSKVEMKVQKVAGNVYLIQGVGGNIGVSVGDDGVLVIDDEYAPLAPKIKEAIKSITDKPVRWILNTHFHGDHTGSNAEFAKSGTEIIAQDNVRKRLESGFKLPKRQVPPAPHEALPIITFDNSLTMHINGEDIRALHYANGHTDGDSVIFFPKSNVVHMGDDFFNMNFPFVDLEGGGSVQGMVKNVRGVLKDLPDDVKVIPGHGALATKAELAKFADMLDDCIAAVRAALKKKLTLEQMKQQHVLAKYESLSWEFIKTDDFIDAVYHDLTDAPVKQTTKRHHE
jgi:glyoxylase-like metal-dependent hydrolase (beta-lactamase superfamily II)